MVSLQLFDFSKGAVMRFGARKSFRLGPVRWNWTHRGPSSLAIRIWRFTYNLTTRRWTFNSPGPGAFSGGGRRKSGKESR